MEARGDVRWDGTFNCCSTPSTARDMADKVVRWRKNQTPRFCALEMAKKKLVGGRTSVLGVIFFFEHGTNMTQRT